MEFQRLWDETKFRNDWRFGCFRSPQKSCVGVVGYRQIGERRQIELNSNSSYHHQENATKVHRVT
jgi:hypothetical protein